MESEDEPAPRLFAPLPGRTTDNRATFEQCLSELIDLLGAARPLPIYTGREWQHQARSCVRVALRKAPPECFDLLVRAAVYDPNPSFNRQLVEPGLRLFGRRRVQEALLAYLRTGTNPERAGAARAWYWTWLRTESEAGGADDTGPNLGREWAETALRVFVENDDLDVRRCLLPMMSLKPKHYREELRGLVAEAIHIARTDPDEYLRHRVEHQV
jgi:hypothetical protein